MKRRTFLTATSTVGIVGVASSATVVSSVYNNYSLNILLEDFDDSNRTVLDKFVSDIKENAEAHGLNTAFAKELAMPAHIISMESNKGGQNIIYKNKAGQTISLSVENGVRFQSA